MATPQQHEETIAFVMCAWRNMMTLPPGTTRPLSTANDLPVLRIQLLDELVGLDHFDLAIDLVQKIPKDTERLRAAEHVLFVLVEQGRSEEARAFADTLFSSAFWRFRLRLALYQYRPTGSELGALRALLDTIAGADDGIHVHAANCSLNLWRASHDAYDLMRACKYADSYRSPLRRTRAYGYIGLATGVPSYFQTAFMTAMTTDSPEIGVLVDWLLHHIETHACAHGPNHPPSITLGACVDIIRDLRGINGAWADQLHEILIQADILPKDAKV